MTDPVPLPEWGSVFRQERRNFLQIFALCGFAVVQPVLDVFGKSPETFVFRAAGPKEVFLFALLVTVAPAVTLWLAGFAARSLGSPVRRLVHSATILLLTSVALLQALKHVSGLRGALLLAVSLAAGTAVAVGLMGRRLRGWEPITAVAPVAFLAVFLLGSPASKLLRSVPVSLTAPPQGRLPPVVVLMLDELPLLSLLDERGEIDRAAFPNFAAFRDTSTWYRNYTVTSPSTTQSVPTILSGRVSGDPSKTPLATDHPNNLFTMLGKTHRMEVIEVATRLCPRELCAARPDARNQGGVGALVSDATGVWRDLSLPGEITRDVTAQFEPHDSRKDAGKKTGGRRSVAFDPFIDSLRRGGDRPGLYFLHVMLPHSPWRFFPSGSWYQTLVGNEDRPAERVAPGPTRWLPGRWPAEFGRLRHLLQVQYIDRQLGRVMARLKETGLGDEAVIVVTADHGIGLHQGRTLRTISAGNMHEIMWVPLFIKAPGQREGRVDDRNLMSIDFLPTVAGLLGARVPFEVDGIAADDPGVDRRTTKLIAGFHLLDGGKAGRISYEPYAIPPAQVAAARTQLNREVYRPAVAESDDRFRFYLVGPRPDLIGRPLDELVIGAPSEMSATLALPAPGKLQSVGAGVGSFPALVWGGVEGARGPDRLWVAVALNGRIASVAETFTSRAGPGRLAALIPDFLFNPGANRLELFLVVGRVLRPLTFEQSGP